MTLLCAVLVFSVTIYTLYKGSVCMLGMREVRLEVTLADQLVNDAAVCEEVFTGKYYTVIYRHNISFHPIMQCHKPETCYTH